MTNLLSIAEDEGVEVVGTTIYKSSRYIHNKNKFKVEEVGYDEGNNYFTEKLVWLPRQDQIQSMFVKDLTGYSKIKSFMRWIDSNIQYTHEDYSLEILWLMCYMDLYHNKKWSFSESAWFLKIE